MQDTGNPITTDAWLRGACKGDTANGTTPYKKKIEPNGQPDNPNKGDRRINVTVKQPQSGAAKYSTNNHNAGDCVGDDLRVTVPGGSNGAFTKQARYGGGVYTAVIEIE